MSHLECEQVFAMLSEYLDEQLPAANCAEFEKHLADCPQCVAFVQSLRQCIRLCRTLDAPRDLPPMKPEQIARLRQAYREALQRRSQS